MVAAHSGKCGFQSTRPAWGATSFSAGVQSSCTYFNPRAPCGARPLLGVFLRGVGVISVHAPRVGRDGKEYTVSGTLMVFQSTRPVWGATMSAMSFPARPCHFNPRAPCGARPRVSSHENDVVKISIHAPRVGRDGSTDTGKPSRGISIHAPRVGRDVDNAEKGVADLGFQSTRPVWGATRVTDAATSTDIFQSTRPVWGATANLTILPRQICTKGTKEFLLGRKTHGKKEKQSKSLLTFTHFRPFWGAKVPELSARLYFAPNTARLSARLRHHSPLWHRNARCGCDTYPQGSKSAGCPRIHP